MSVLPPFASVDPFNGMTPGKPGIVRNLLRGEWLDGERLRQDIPDPLNGGCFLQVPDTGNHSAYVASLRSCPKSGLHNPFKNPQRYIQLGQVCARAAALLAEKETEDYFTRLIQRVMPKAGSSV
jgi:1-pyrroline-5-carboxylate dehydrogenase